MVFENPTSVIINLKERTVTDQNGELWKGKNGKKVAKLPIYTNTNMEKAYDELVDEGMSTKSLSTFLGKVCLMGIPEFMVVNGLLQVSRCIVLPRR
jgi:hypothetical protein